jgi:hypothetical protein
MTLPRCGSRSGGPATTSARRSVNTFDQLVRLMRTFPAGTNLAVAYHYKDATGAIKAHIIAGLVGKNKDVLFVDPQLKPVREAVTPTFGWDFHIFAVTHKPR